MAGALHTRLPYAFILPSTFSQTQFEGHEWQARYALGFPCIHFVIYIFTDVVRGPRMAGALCTRLPHAFILPSTFSQTRFKGHEWQARYALGFHMHSFCLLRFHRRGSRATNRGPRMAGALCTRLPHAFILSSTFSQTRFEGHGWQARYALGFHMHSFFLLRFYRRGSRATNRGPRMAGALCTRLPHAFILPSTFSQTRFDGHEWRACYALGFHMHSFCLLRFHRRGSRATNGRHATHLITMTSMGPPGMA